MKIWKLNYINPKYRDKIIFSRFFITEEAARNEIKKIGSLAFQSLEEVEDVNNMARRRFKEVIQKIMRDHYDEKYRIYHYRKNGISLKEAILDAAEKCDLECHVGTACIERENYLSIFFSCAWIATDDVLDFYDFTLDFMEEN